MLNNNLSVVADEMRQHPVSDAEAPTTASDKQAAVSINITNAEFLGAIFQGIGKDEYLWTTSFVMHPKKAGDEEWNGSKTYLDHVRDTPHGNSYFSVSAYKPIKRIYKRRVSHISCMPLVALDDPQKCTLTPSWRLETSPDNYQVGLLLDEPITHIDVASRLLKALVEQGFIPVDKNGNIPNRYMRLPVGRNTKYDPPFQCRLVDWNPAQKYSLKDVCAALAIDYDQVLNGDPKKPAQPKKVSQPTSQTILDLASAIEYLDADDYDDWIKIGLALSSLKGTDLEDSALELFHQASAKSDKYDAAECDKKWDKALDATQLGYQTIFYLAQQKGWVNPSSKVGVKEFNPLWSLAQKLEMEEDELAEAIEYKPEVVQNIVTSCAFSQTSGKFLVMERSGDLRTFHKGDLAVGFAGTFGRTHDGEKLVTVASDYADNQMLLAPNKKDFISSCASSIFNQMQRHILVKRQYSDLQIIVDMFVTESSVLLHDGQATITYPHGAFPTGPINSAVVSDYKQHWAMFDEFLDLVVAARFARSRKKAFLWIMTQSDWGKSFLLSLFSNLGLVIEMSTQEVERAFSGQPIGQTVRNFKRAWIMAVEEFKSVKSELKQLEQKMLFSPKGLPTVTAPLYLKLFLSAERVESLASDESGVEDQFANRFSILEPDGGRLSERPLFQQGRGGYIDSLTNYVADYLNRKVSEYRALGEIGASNRGDSIVEAFHQAHGAGQKFERLSNKIPQLAEQFQEWILSNYRSAKNALANLHGRRLSSNEQAVLESAIIKDELGKVLYIKRAAKLLDQWLNDTFNQSERGKLLFKRTDILAQLPQSKTIYFEYGHHKAMRIGYIDSHHDFDPNDYREERAGPH